MFSTVLPCALCRRRVLDTVKTHNRRFIDYEKRMDRLLRLKSHYYNSSESQHQLDKNVFKLNSLSSVESKTYFQWEPFSSTVW